MLWNSGSMVKGIINLYFFLVILGMKLEYWKEFKIGVSFFGFFKVLFRFVFIIWLVIRDCIIIRECMKNWVCGLGCVYFMESCLNCGIIFILYVYIFMYCGLNFLGILFGEDFD